MDVRQTFIYYDLNHLETFGPFSNFRKGVFRVVNL